MDDLLNLDTYGTAAMQSHQISGISNHGLITTRKVPQPTKAEFFLRLESFVLSKGDTEEGRMAKEYVGTLRYLSEEFRGLLPGGGPRQVPSWSLGGGLDPPGTVFEVLGGDYLGGTFRPPPPGSNPRNS
jgi:hypothetical protein